MTATVIDRWLSVIEGGQTAQLDDMLAEDAVFYSPAVFTPQHGRAKAATYLRAAEHLFAGTGFHYVNKWIDTNSAVLEFAAVVDGFAVEGVDILHWNDAGKLTSVKVMVRPFKGLQTVIAKMAELLSAQ
ncbi:MAG: nuclear transport factor 2 family protein [Mycobacterium sp.]|jgi:hypothetical protein|nr:nuclear transport factor 2 family protein [Mycobacterium sp.]